MIIRKVLYCLRDFGGNYFNSQKCFHNTLIDNEIFFNKFIFFTVSLPVPCPPLHSGPIHPFYLCRKWQASHEYQQNKARQVT